MSWLYARVPEPESMDESGEAERYAGAAAERHLARLDTRFVRSLLEGHRARRILQAEWKRPA